MSTTRNLLISVLVVAVLVLGYMYYQETRNNVTVTIDPPNVTVN